MLSSLDVLELNEWVSLNKDYLDTLKHITETGHLDGTIWLEIKNLVRMQKNTSQGGRLVIRLAVLQAFVDKETRLLTYGELTEYWDTCVKLRLDSKFTHDRSINSFDVTDMSTPPAGKIEGAGEYPLTLHDSSLTSAFLTNTSEKASSHQTSIGERQYTQDHEFIAKNLESETVRDVRIRRTQYIFRSNVVALWKNCSLTGTRNLAYLIASHIKPWSRCNSVERIDPENGLLLTPNLDKLFDLGHITFDDSGALIMSEALRLNDDHTKLGDISRLKLSLPMSERMQNYMAFHRENIFLRSIES